MGQSAGRLPPEAGGPCRNFGKCRGGWLLKRGGGGARRSPPLHKTYPCLPHLPRFGEKNYFFHARITSDGLGLSVDRLNCEFVESATDNDSRAGGGRSGRRKGFRDRECTP